MAQSIQFQRINFKLQVKVNSRQVATVANGWLRISPLTAAHVFIRQTPSAVIRPMLVDKNIGAIVVQRLLEHFFFF